MTKRQRILDRLNEGASPETINREYTDRLEACSWSHILNVAREWRKAKAEAEAEADNDGS